MKNTPEDQLSLDFEKDLIVSSEIEKISIPKQNLRLVYSKVESASTAVQAVREKALSDVLSFARSLKW